MTTASRVLSLDQIDSNLLSALEKTNLEIALPTRGHRLERTHIMGSLCAASTSDKCNAFEILQVCPSITAQACVPVSRKPGDIFIIMRCLLDLSGPSTPFLLATSMELVEGRGTAARRF